MRTNELVIRCYAKKEGEAWVAVAVDLCLAAQAESVESAKAKLEDMIHSYIEDAFTIDNQYAHQLLSRKAPLSQRVEYHWAAFVTKFTSKIKDQSKLFTEVLPLKLAN
jgi:predicted RNase H-like HicB family nuclease